MDGLNSSYEQVRRKSQKVMTDQLEINSLWFKRKNEGK